MSASLKGPMRVIAHASYAWKLSVIYFSYGLLWVVGTDGLISNFPVSVRAMQLIQSLKGTLFLIFSTALLYILVTLHEERVRRLNAVQQEANDEIILRLAEAIEMRDMVTKTHNDRISKYCRVIGNAVGMDKANLDLLVLAAPLHDVGKVGLPDSILKKKGLLTAEEMALVRMHPEIGSRILYSDSNGLMQVAARAALTHHENWDGTGYPKGLKGKEIPLDGRILAVCDVLRPTVGTALQTGLEF
jgi:response regulator RpfG family c-di-GMP phosphodiesterase